MKVERKIQTEAEKSLKRPNSPGLPDGHFCCVWQQCAMGAFRQTMLLLWKNVLLRLRSPGILAIEVLWPILIVGIVSVMRTAAPPTKSPDCHYQHRAMPSTGAVPFLQSLACNLGSRCYKSEEETLYFRQYSQRFTQLVQKVAPYLGTEEILNLLVASSNYTKLTATAVKLAEAKDIMPGLERALNISRYFRDPEAAKEVLIKDHNFPQTVADALIRSKIKLSKVFNLQNTSDFKTIVCDPGSLMSYLKFPADTETGLVSSTLCAMNDSNISDVVDHMIQMLNITAVIDTLALFEKVKERFDNSTSLSSVFDSLAEASEIVISSTPIIKYLGNFAAIPNVVDLIKKIPYLIKGFIVFSSALDIIEDLVFAVEPLIVHLGVENSTAWRLVDDTVKLNIHLRRLSSSQWNGTAEELMQPMEHLLHNVKLLSQENSISHITAIVDFITKIEWLSISNQIRETKLLKKETILHFLKTFQQLLNHFPDLAELQNIAKAEEQILEIISLLTNISRGNTAILLDHAYQELILLLGNITVSPRKLLDLFLQGGVQVPDCKTQFFSDYILPKNRTTHSLEMFICMLTTLQANDITDGLSILKTFVEKVTRSKRDVYMSTYWSTTMAFIQRFLNLSFQEVSDHSLFTMNLSLNEFYNAADTLGAMNLKQMCNTLNLHLNNSENNKDETRTASMIVTAFILISDLLQILPEIDELACAFVSQADFDFGGIMNRFKSIDLWNNIVTAIIQFISPAESINCSALLHANSNLLKTIHSVILENGFNADLIAQCVTKTDWNVEVLLTSFLQTANFVKELLTILQLPELQILLEDPYTFTVINFIVDVISSKSQVMHVANLLKDKARVEDYLITILGLQQDDANSFLNATVHNDWVDLLTNPNKLVASILCDPDKLSSVISLPDLSSVNIIEMSTMLCTSEITDTVTFLKDMSVSSETIWKNKSNQALMDVIEDICIDLSDIILEYRDILMLSMKFTTEFNINVLKNNTDIIDGISKGHTLTKLADSLDQLVDTIATLLGEESKMVIRDMRKILRGILSVDVLKDFILREAQMKNLEKDPDRLILYLTSTLGFNDDIAQEVMDAAFSSQMFLGAEGHSPYTCDEVFKMLIMLNSSNATENSVRNAFCILNDANLRSLAEKFVSLSEVPIGDMIAKYIDNTGRMVLRASNLTAEDINDLLQKLHPGLEAINEVYEKIMQNSHIARIILNNFGESLNMSTLALNICGSWKLDIFDLSFSPGLAFSSVDDINNEQKNEKVESDPDLSDEFCIGIHQEIVKSGIGSIIWSYLKPIIRGKILYTPDNPITRRIMSMTSRFFDLLSETTRVANIWAKELPNLMGLALEASSAVGLQDALEYDFVKELLEATSEIKPQELLSSIRVFQSSNFSKSQLDTIQTGAELIANYSSCIVTDRFQPVSSEIELERKAYRLSQTKNFLAGIVFLNVGEHDNTSDYSGHKQRRTLPIVPEHIGYKIRMDVDNVMDTNRIKSSLWKMSGEDNFLENMRYLRGFIYLQDMIDSAIIDIHKDQKLYTPGFKIKQMPFPCHHEDNFIFLLGSYLVPIIMTFTFLASLGAATHNLVYDRENGQEENLHVMGMKSGLNFISWFISTMTIMTVVSFILSMMLKYTNIFIYSNNFIIFLYIVDFCFSSVMLLYMVSAFFVRTTMAILFVLMAYLISYLPYILMTGLEISAKFWHETLACLASTTAFSFGALRLAYLEEGGLGIQWDNLTEARSEDVSFSWVCIMMLIDSVCYFLVGWYVRIVKPGKYGVSQPWYFPVTRSFWCRNFRLKTSNGSRCIQTTDDAGKNNELSLEDRIVGIAIKNLSKTYSNKKRAIENLTVNFYQDQITCLMGINGAAKTTTMKIICGVLEPTSGCVLINGCQTKTHQTSLGICPQQNALFSYMTVYEHMKLFASIKGASNSKETQKEIKRLLKDVDLWHMRNISVKNISYGMKRRLCVALAFVGGSKTIILDEPTSGVDPQARKSIWNIITGNKLGRTIVLSTHHLDEADFLSDQIAVMHQGKLLCCGSPAFLKKKFGGGFSLTIAMKDQALAQYNENHVVTDLNAEQSSRSVFEYIKSLCPGADVMEQVGTDITFNIPKNSSQMIPVHELFRHLDQFADQLGIASYGVSDTTLEEVFLKLVQAADTCDGSGSFEIPVASLDITESLDKNDTDSHVSEPLSRPVKRRKGADLMLSQIGALLLKRCHHYRRNWRILTSVLILPVIGLLISMGFSAVRINDGDMKPLILDPFIYGPQTHTFYQNSAGNMMASRFVHTLTNSSLGIGTLCMNDWIIKYSDNTSCLMDSPWYNITNPAYLVGCKNSRQIYTEKQEMYTLSEMIVSSDVVLQKIEGQMIPYYLLTTFKDYKENRYGGWSFEKKVDGSSSDVDLYVWFNSKGYHAMPSYFNSMSNIVLRSLLPSDKLAENYGITTINHPLKLGRAALSVKSLQGDAADAGVALMVVVAFSFIPCGFILYVINERIQKERQLQNISGVSLCIYWSVTFVWDMFVFTIAVGVAVIIVVIFKIDSYYIRKNLIAFAAITLLYGWAVIPCLYSVTRLFKNGSTAYLVTFCLNLFISLITIISLLVLQLFSGHSASEAYKVLKYLYLVFPQYALGQGLLNMAGNTVKYKLFIRYGEDKYDDPFSTDVIGWHLVALGCEGLLFFILTLLLDGIPEPTISLPDKMSQRKFIVDDEDVLREQERIHQSSNNDLLVVNSLAKVYRRGRKNFWAVNHISFGVAQGESFGLLGVNGAGKTTTFRMLTGDSRPSNGNIFLKQHKMTSSDRRFGQNVGYCPQEGGLDEYLTSEEVLCFHSRLRGFDVKQTKTLVSELLKRLALTQYSKRAVHTYSGGTKRKLALAVALLGSPSILYLDEPTTGMDAATRRLAWKCIEQAYRNGQSVVLTSHSMDECDSLCSRIAIMVNGQIKCIGSPQHLKNKYGQGYIVIVHASHNNLNEIISKFLNKFPAMSVKAKHHSSVELRVPQTSGSVADILFLLQDESIIDYYSLSQTTLDSVFISFAQEQMDSYEDDGSSERSSIAEANTVSASDSISSLTT